MWAAPLVDIEVHVIGTILEDVVEHISKGATTKLTSAILRE